MALLRIAFLILLLGTCALAEPPHSFSILHFSDADNLFPFDESSNPGRHAGGFAYLETLIRQARQHGPALLLHAGDFLSPSILSNQMGYQGAQMVAAMNLMGIDAVTFGNHEFDFGCDVLETRIRESNFPWLSANLRFPAGERLPKDKVMPFTIVRVAGMRVAIFGLCLPVHPVAPCTTGPISFTDPLQAAGEVMPDIRRQAPDLIVALTHLPEESDKELAGRFPGIDLIVSGHDHRVIDTLRGKTLIAEAGANAKLLGIVGISALRAGNQWVVQKSWVSEAVDSETIKPDPGMLALLQPYAQKLDAFTRVVGRTLVPLEARNIVVRKGESNFGDLVADLMRERMHADVALFNGGSFRTDRVLGPGEITRGDLDSTLPYQNRVLAIQVTGRQLLQALENGVSMLPETSGRFPHVSGMTVHYDSSKSAGRRIVSVSVKGSPLDPNKTYLLATTDFMINKGEMDGYSLPTSVAADSGETINQLLIARLREGPVSPALDGRIAED